MTFYRWNDAQRVAEPAQTVKRIREAQRTTDLWQIPL